VYCTLYLELDIATEADTLEGAKKNLREAVEGYVKSVVRDDEEDDFIPRAVPEEVIKEYELRFHPKTLKSMIRQSRLREEVFLGT
jgi:predicted RNase H-like HicB family nuclease